MRSFKTLFVSSLLSFVLFACSTETVEKDHIYETEPVETVTKTEVAEDTKYPPGAILLVVKIKTNLSEEELTKRAKERAPQFAAFTGLIQKYYFKTGAPGEFGGVYVWDSAESLKSYKESELAATIAQAYETIEPPVVEKLDIMFQLRK